MTIEERAKNLVDALLNDLDDRSGMDTGAVDDETMAEWRARWAAMIVKTMKELQEEA